jgi:protein CpxP
MKRGILVAVLTLLVWFLSTQGAQAQGAQAQGAQAQGAQAQGAQAQGAQAQGMQKFEQLSRQLNLTPAQKVQLIPILRAEAPKVEAIKANTSLSRVQKLAQVKALHDQTDPQVRSILTPEQYQNLQEIRRSEIQQTIRKKLNQ